MAASEPTASSSSPPDRSETEDAPRPLLSEIGSRLFQALRQLRGSSPFRDSLQEVIEESDRQTHEISSEERLLLANLLKFGELKVEDVMVPRAEIVAVEEQATLDDVFNIFLDAQHSRLPLYRETLDDPIGMIHIKDVLGRIERDGSGGMHWKPTALTEIAREVLYVPSAMPLTDLLLKMQTSHIHLAVVIDEYGGTEGLASIEDIVEEIVGDIDDEHDVDEEPQIIARPDGSFDADARADLEDFKERTGFDLAASESEEDVDTLGGLVLAELGRLPKRGEIVPHPQGFEIEVLEADVKRVKRLRIRPPASQRAASAAR
jgi:magnesium and cobalt transporter